MHESADLMLSFQVNRRPAAAETGDATHGPRATIAAGSPRAGAGQSPAFPPRDEASAALYIALGPDLGARVEQMGGNKVRTLAQVEYNKTRTEYEPFKLDKLSRCADFLMFKTHPTEPARLTAGEFCQMPMMCAVCAHRRGVRMTRMYADRWARLCEMCIGREECKHYQLLHVVFTIRNQTDLFKGFRHLTRSVRKVIERGRLSAQRSDRDRTAFTDALGGVWCVEVTRNAEAGTWHPHVHMLVVYNGWLDQRSLSNEWLGITGDSSIVHVSHIGKLSKVANELAQGMQPGGGGTWGALLETFKYALKFSGMSPAETYQAAQILTRKPRINLVSSWGLLRGLPPVDEHDDSEEDAPPMDDGTARTHAVRFTRSRKRYRVVPVAAAAAPAVEYDGSEAASPLVGPTTPLEEMPAEQLVTCGVCGVPTALWSIKEGDGSGICRSCMHPGRFAPIDDLPF